MTDTDWIEWNGGPCPVEPETRVDVRFRDEVELAHLQAYRFDWEHSGPAMSNLVAYRIAKEKQG